MLKEPSIPLVILGQLSLPFSAWAQRCNYAMFCGASDYLGHMDGTQVVPAEETFGTMWCQGLNLVRFNHVV